MDAVLCATLLDAYGLSLRGRFAVNEEDPVPQVMRSGVLIGHLGADFWQHFEQWRSAQPDLGGANPLDAWSKAVVDPIAAAIGGVAVYPSDRPWLPFQRWAKRAEGLKPAPFGILMHPLAGPWHAYRAAILFEHSFISEGLAPFFPHPCDACPEKPCLSACPVDAVRPNGLNVDPCRGHLASPAGTACMNGGCLARNACPVGSAYRYSDEQQAFHQRAYVKD